MILKEKFKKVKCCRYLQLCDVVNKINHFFPSNNKVKFKICAISI